MFENVENFDYLRFMTLTRDFKSVWVDTEYRLKAYTVVSPNKGTLKICEILSNKNFSTEFLILCYFASLTANKVCLRTRNFIEFSAKGNLVQ